MFNPERDLSGHGAVGPNQSGYVNIRPQADGSYLAMSLGVASTDDQLIETGVRALEFGLPYQYSNGAFEGSSDQDVARFALLGLRASTLLAHSRYASQYEDRLEPIYEALSRSNTRLLDLLSRHPEVYNTTNQVAMLAYVFIVGGQVAEDEQLLVKGDELLQWVLSSQRANGVFPENGGHDSHYQAASLMALTNIYLYSDEKRHREAIYPALEAGFEWEQSRISALGHIDDTGNTRTANDPDFSPEGKQIDPREVALILLYLSYLGPGFNDARSLSDALIANL